MIPVPTRVPAAGGCGQRAGLGSPGSALRVLRELTGALAVGLVVLTMVLAVAQWRSGSATVSGPGTGMLAGHGAGAVIALLLQRVADRSHGGRVVAASLAVLFVVVAVLWFGWWR